jgi:hypothetical protein
MSATGTLFHPGSWDPCQPQRGTALPHYLDRNRRERAEEAMMFFLSGNWKKTESSDF